jgi:hypothetical protein
VNLINAEQNKLRARGLAVQPTLPAVLQALKRTLAVYRLQRVQSDFSQSLGHICQLACLALNAPRALVALVACDGDQYPLQAGFRPPLAVHDHQLGPTLCHYTVALAEPLAINDTHLGLPW